MITIEFVEGKSTTKTIEKIKGQTDENLRLKDFAMGRGGSVFGSRSLFGYRRFAPQTDKSVVTDALR